MFVDAVGPAGRRGRARTRAHAPVAGERSARSSPARTARSGRSRAAAPSGSRSSWRCRPPRRARPSPPTAPHADDDSRAALRMPRRPGEDRVAGAHDRLEVLDRAGRCRTASSREERHRSRDDHDERHRRSSAVRRPCATGRSTSLPPRKPSASAGAQDATVTARSMRNGENTPISGRERKGHRADRKPDAAEVAITTPRDPPAGQDADEDDQGERSRRRSPGRRPHAPGCPARCAGSSRPSRRRAWSANEGPHATAHSRPAATTARSPRPRAPIARATPATANRPAANRNPETWSNSATATIDGEHHDLPPCAAVATSVRRSIAPRRRGARAARTSEPRRRGGSGTSCTRAPPVAISPARPRWRIHAANMTSAAIEKRHRRQSQEGIGRARTSQRRPQQVVEGRVRVVACAGTSRSRPTGSRAAVAVKLSSKRQPVEPRSARRRKAMPTATIATSAPDQRAVGRGARGRRVARTVARG